MRKRSKRPLIYLYAENGSNQMNTRIGIKAAGFDNIVTLINPEHLLQEIYHEPDMIILDMDINDGLAGPLLKAIQSELPYCDITFLTEDDEFESIRQLLNYGAFNFVKKDEEYCMKLSRILRSANQWNDEIRT